MVRHLLGTAAAVALLSGPVFAQDTTEDAAETGGMTVQQCAPVVTVTQTPPQVTVTIPEDASAEPVVTVTQAAPDVTVENCAPTLTGADGEEVQAEFMEAEADITINAAETAELTISRMGANGEGNAPAEAPAAEEEVAEERPAEPAAQAAPDDMTAETDNKDEMGEAPKSDEAAALEAESAPEAEVEAAADNMVTPLADTQDGVVAEPATDAETMPTEAMPASDPQAPDAAASGAAASDEAAADAAATGVAPSAGEITASANAIALREGRSLVEAEDVMAEGVDGTPVFSSDDEEVGEITMFDTESESAIVGVGGFLGLGEKNVALPLTDLSFQKDEDGELRAYIATPSDRIEALPEHEASE